jgi:nucleoside-diphosphate-sugar epimerase
VSRVLVTGATGFIGRHTLAPLVDRGFEVHAVTSRPDDADSGDDVMWHRADLLTPGAESELVERAKPTHLLHLAWYAEPGAFWRSPENLRWVEASLRLLRAFSTAGGRRAVMSGTCAEYAWTDRVHCVEGQTRLEPATLYGASKHGLRTVAAPYADGAGISFAWGRVFFVFGPYEHPARLASSVARAVTRGEPAPVSHGEQLRDFLHVADLADAFAALLASPTEGAVNLASGTPVRIRDLVQAIGDAAGRPDLLEFGARPASSGEPSELTADVARLRDEVGWVPHRSLRERVAETVEWWRTIGSS